MNIMKTYQELMLWILSVFTHLLLNPEEHQPSGTCNFSRIDSAEFELTNAAATTQTVLQMYAINYNVLRIMSGMGGLAYSN